MFCARLSSTGSKCIYILMYLQALGVQLDFLGLW